MDATNMLAGEVHSMTFDPSDAIVDWSTTTILMWYWEFAVCVAMACIMLLNMRTIFRKELPAADLNSVFFRMAVGKYLLISIFAILLAQFTQGVYFALWSIAANPELGLGLARRCMLTLNMKPAFITSWILLSCTAIYVIMGILLASRRRRTIDLPNQTPDDIRR
jgi:hypothetical protein